MIVASVKVLRSHPLIFPEETLYILVNGIGIYGDVWTEKTQERNKKHHKETKEKEDVTVKNNFMVSDKHPL